ncbi:hypothetical protein ACHAWC_004535 [Mediolabrus comicus]
MLHGDGVSFSFFQLLWSKEKEKKNESEVPMRIPDTVIFQFGVPNVWFFTSKNGGPNRDQTKIMRKRKTNLTIAHIEEVFLDKASSRGTVGDDDVVAYFIEQRQGNTEQDDASSFCNIEYFNPRTLHDFLQDGKANKNGILQRFIAPHGGRYNSQIRAVWTPKLCLQERRRTKQDLHDTRFALYERAITFDGPENYSVSVPLRGTVLAGRVQRICNEISNHISTVLMQEDSTMESKSRVAKMVVNFKMDGNGRLWILWSDSVRLETMPCDTTSILSKVEPSSPLQVHALEPLNFNTIVELAPSTKLSQVPNHRANLKLSNKMKVASCPSCNREDFEQHFQPVPYKTIIQHFDATLEMLRSHDESHPSKVWPPEDRFIRAAGGVGFGMLKATTNHDKDSQSIPPVIRHIHPKLRVKGFQMYQDDPSFLLKTCSVCEDCCLSYNNLASTSFMMTKPLEIPDAAASCEGRNAVAPSFSIEEESRKGKQRGAHKGRNSDNDKQFFEEKYPQMPAAIKSVSPK